MRLPFKFLEPAFFAGLLDDPLLLVQVRPLGRSLLFDCGQIHHLAKRVLRSIDAVFISHAHMDHFMGVDTLARHVLVSPRTIDLFGPPGIAGKLERKLGSYDWNLTEEHWCSFRAREIDPESKESRFLLPGPEGFACRFEGDAEPEDGVIFRNRWLTVKAATGDHKIPVLFYRIDETPGFAIDDMRIAAAGLTPGPWLRELKGLFFRHTLPGSRVRVPHRSGEGEETLAVDAAELYRKVRQETPAASIGYFTDLGLTAENRERLVSLLSGVTLLIGECTYLRQDVERARASFHLCTADINQLLDDLRPTFFLPMHLSKSYLGQSERLYQELEPPPETTILRLPEHLTPRPLIPAELPPAARGKI